MADGTLTGKVVMRGAALKDRLEKLPRPLVFTNGVFDVLHCGHVTYLDAAARLGAALLVAINTDRSTRQLGKGSDRPMNQEADRALVLAGLAAVTTVTFFDELTPVELIRETRPDIYVKGGDYDMERLEETHVVRSWGGQSLALPFVAGYSTTELIKKIRLQQGMPAEPRRAVFLDRDGVINIDRSYVHRWEDFEFVPGAVDAVRRLKAAGYMVVVVTNQAGLARGLYTEAEYAELTRRMRLALSEGDADVDAVYHCPHHLGGSVATLSINCECRKPAPGMLLQAARDLNLSLPDSILIGDKPSDIEAARRAELRLAYGVHSNNAESGQQVLGADATFDSLAACVDHLLSAGITPQV